MWNDKWLLNIPLHTDRQTYMNIYRQAFSLREEAMKRTGCVWGEGGGKKTAVHKIKFIVKKKKRRAYTARKKSAAKKQTKKLTHTSSCICTTCLPVQRVSAASAKRNVG